ncbi:hypothetical protein ACWERV_22885 [Streptomyces sp. NPDC004031]
MSFDHSNPHVFSCFFVLHPNHLIHEIFGLPDATLNLPEALAGSAPYATLTLTDGAELHYQPASATPANRAATALAARFGADGPSICGGVHITGSSCGTDTALGMTDEVFLAIYGKLLAACADIGVRLWRQFRPGDLVTIRYTDLARGDLFWFGGRSHRLVDVRDLPPGQESKLDQDAKFMVFDDGEEFLWYPTGTFHDRADRAPAGYWQRTGNQLLPADPS